MKRLHSKRLSIVIVGLAAGIISITAIAETFYKGDVEEYYLSVDDEQLHFIAQPQAGYVIKTRKDIGSMDILSQILKTDADVQINPINSLGRKGLCIVHNEFYTEKIDGSIKSLRVNNEVQYTAPLFSSNGEIVAIIPEIVVRVKLGIEIEQVQALCETAGCTIIKLMEFTEQEYLIEVLGIDADAVFKAIDQLSKISFVEWACPNTTFQPKLCGQVIPNDEYFSELWHLHNTGQISLYGASGTPNVDINAPAAWEITTGDPNIIVAVVDSGVDTSHPDLINNLVPGYDFRDDDDRPYPSAEYFGNFHGTACAGLIAAEGNNGIGVTGVTWNCSIMPIRIRGGGEIATLSIESDIATAYRWAAAHGADILSNSWDYVAPVPIIHSALLDITKQQGIGRGGKGCVVLVAAGNDGDVLQWPARYAEVIAVGATDNADIRHEYSNYGEELDIVAPGGAGDLNSLGRGTLCTTDISGSLGQNNKWGTLLYGPLVDIDIDYAYMGGTSSACPVAAGVAALILSVDPNLTNEEVKQILYRSAHDLGDPGWDQYYGWGRVDARAAVEMALSPHIYIDYDSPADFNNIQAGIDAANDGDTVFVAPGNYVINEPITFKGKAITVRSKAGPEATTIRMSESPGDPDRASVIIFENGETETSVLDGFTISGGKGFLWEPAPGYSYQVGGGILCNNSSPTIIGCIISENDTANRLIQDMGGGLALLNSSCTFLHCVIGSNHAAYWAGGAYIFDGSPNLIDCKIIQNTVTHQNGQGGGLIADGLNDSKPVLLRCTISENFAQYVAGGIQVTNDSQPILRKCLILHNTSGSIGGILGSFSSTTTLTNCTINSNSAVRRCGGIGAGHYGEVILDNCTITENTAGIHSGGILSYDNSSMIVKNCIIYDNLAPSGPEIGLDFKLNKTPTAMTISYSNIKGGISAVYFDQDTTLNWGTDIIDTDPLFADAENGDYHLKSQAGHYDPIGESWVQDNITSPCIDAGDPNSSVGLETLPNGNRINMGAYGGTLEASKSLSAVNSN